MKKISALLIIFSLLLPMLMFSASAAVSNEIVIFGGACYAQTSGLERSEKDGIRIGMNQYVGYRVNFENPTSVLKLDYISGYEHLNIVEVRLGSTSGKLLDSFDSRDEMSSSTWARAQHIFSFDEPLIGQQSIFLVARGGNHWITQLTFISSGNQTFDSYEDSDNFEDIKDDSNRSKINLLSDLGMIPKTEKNFMPTIPMTRYEFVSMVGRLINAESYSNGESPFKDIDTSNEFASILTGLYQMGIIKGDTDGNFWPYRFITLTEAATVCINALGYQPFAKGTINSLEIADELELFKGVDMTEKTISNSDGAAIIYNLLLCDYLKVREYADDAIFYESTKNFLEKNTVYKHSFGVVTSNKVTDLNEAKISKGIKIEDEFFETEGINVTYLGVLCEYFYTEVGGTKTLKALRPAPKAEVTVIKSQPDISFSKINEREIVYTSISDDEKYEFELVAKTSIIYNGTALNGSLKSLITPAAFMGTITLIDNDSDGILECVWIDHVSSVVRLSGISGGTIKDDITNKTIITDDKTTGLFINGQSAFTDQLKIGNILYVYESSNTGKNKLTRITYNTTKLSGLIAEKTSNDTVKIDDITYKISSACEDSIYVGLVGTFYIDEFMNIIGYESEESTSMIGAFLGVNRKDSLDYDIQIKLLTESGIEVFEIAKNVKADGVIIKSEEDFYNGKGLFDGIKNLTLKTPVIYKINDQKEIKLIDTVMVGTDGDDDNLAKLGEEAAFRYLGDVLVDTSTWKYLYPARSDAVILKMTSDNDERFYSVSKGFTDRDGSGITVTPYKTEKKSLFADILVSLDWPTDVNYISAPFVFEDIKVKVNGEGEVARFICGESPSGEISFEINENSYSSDETFRRILDSVKKGDLVLPYLTREKLISLELLYLPGGLTANAVGVNAQIYDGVASANGSMKYGTVVETDDGFVKIVLDGQEGFQVYNCSGSKVLVCEETDNGEYKVTSKLSSNAIFEGEKIMISNSLYSIVSVVYIYRGDRD